MRSPLGLDTLGIIFGHTSRPRDCDDDDKEHLPGKAPVRAWIQFALVSLLGFPARAQLISLQSLVTPSTVISKDGKLVTFAVHGFIEFHSLAELIPYIDSQEHRWNTDLDESARKALRRDLLRGGIDSRVVSMIDERPFETLITHTRADLEQALRQVPNRPPKAIRLSHFLNDGDSPDIPIPIYIDYLNQIRGMARAASGGSGREK